MSSDTQLNRAALLSLVGNAEWWWRHGGVWRVLFALMLLLAAGLLYVPHLDAPKVFDDILFFDSSYVSDYGARFMPEVPRYWPYASFAHQTFLLTQDTAGLRAGNVLLHGLCLLLLQTLLAHLLCMMSTAETKTTEANPQTRAFRHELAAFCAVLPFAVHPVAVYAVAYLIQRTTLMATLFSLLMWLSVLTALRKGSGRWMGLSVICYYFAVYSKQHAVLVPFVALGLIVLYGRIGCAPCCRPSVAANTPLPAWQAPPLSVWVLVTSFAACGVIAVCATLSASTVIGRSYEPLLIYFPEGADWHERVFLLERMHWISIVTQCGLFFKYLMLWIWPDPQWMSVDMREVFQEDPASFFCGLGVIAYLALGGTAFYFLWHGRSTRGHPARRSGLAGLGMLVIWELFPVEFVTVRLQEIFVLYRSYLWMTGGVILLGVVWDALLSHRRAIGLLLLWFPAMLFLGLGAGQRLSTFSSDFALWDDAVRLGERQARSRGHVMGEERAYSNRGVARAKHENQAALADQETAIGLNPRYYFAHYARSVVLGQMGRDQDALAAADRAQAIKPAWTAIDLQRAQLLEKLGRDAESVRALQRACDQGDLNGCYLQHHRTHPETVFLFKPREQGS